MNAHEPSVRSPPGPATGHSGGAMSAARIRLVGGRRRRRAFNARIEAFNAAIAVELGALAAAGRHVAVVDMYTPFVQTPDYQNAR